MVTDRRDDNPAEPRGTGSARDFMPGPRAGLATLSAAAQRCQGCGLYAFATQLARG